MNQAISNFSENAACFTCPLADLCRQETAQAVPCPLSSRELQRMGQELLSQRTALRIQIGELLNTKDTLEASNARLKAQVDTLVTTQSQLQKALDSERNISVAIGITMVQYRCSRSAATKLLRESSRAQNKKFAVLATQIVSSAEQLHGARS